MQWPDEAIAHLEDIVTKLTGEAYLAKPDSDEGLLPILNLVSELTSELPEDPSITGIIESIEATLEPLLKEAKLFDISSIESLKSVSHDLSEHLLNLKSSSETGISKPVDNNVFAPLDGLPSSETALEADTLASPVSTLTGTIGGEQPALFEKLAKQFSEELLLAKNGSDEGMLPIYSLLNELNSEFSAYDFIQISIEPVIARLDILLENGATFDDATINLLTAFNIWLDSALSKGFQGPAPFPFEPDVLEISPVQTDSNASSDSSQSEDLILEFSKFDVVMDLNLEGNQDLLVEFHSEAVDHLEQIESAVLDLEKDVSNREAIDSMFRSFHTIKGVSGFLNLVPMNQLSHEIESLMDRVRNSKLPVFTGIIDLVLDGKDVIGQQIEQISTALISGTIPSEVIPVSSLMARSRWAMEGPEYYATRMGNASIPSEECQISPVRNSPPSPIKDDPDAKKIQRQGSKTKTQESAAIRVNTSKLDNLMDMVSELVIVQTQLQDASKAQSEVSAPLLASITQLARISKELQRASLSLRMVPIKPTFQKMSRIVRDISARVGKKVALEVSGEKTELDRKVVEEISDPLIHMIRNAIDHGLETTECRIKSGKSETGRISLNAYHEGSNIVIELSDDGRGIDPNRILEKAIANGIIDEDESPPKTEVYKLLFSPGLSTAERVTDISGRGVGMDVVLKNIETLRGKIEIDSELGSGSTFKITIPLTMAIIDGLVVKVGSDRFILPIDSVKVALRPDEKALAKIQSDKEILNIQGKFFPLFRLHDHFQIPNAVTDPKEATVVIVETGGQQWGLLVDKMISKQEVVIKSLSNMMQGVSGISGATVLGDGNIALILDLTTLINTA